MRIERLELENWMSYPRVWRDSTGEHCPAIDFSGHPLVLIAGENGAGKSAILEAICYALFAEYPRGNANNEAIRSLEKKATIRLYFSMPSANQDIMYCVERELGRTQTGASLHKVDADKSRKLCERAKVLIVDKQQPVTDYIRDKLLHGITYTTFVSSVFLRQQETGKFMGLAHGEQRTQLLSLCQLDIYDDIYNMATYQRRQVDELVKFRSADFSKVQHATDEKLQVQTKLTEQMSLAWTEAERLRTKAKDIFDSARRAEELYYKIKDIGTRLSDWKKIIERKIEIEYSIIWQKAWERVSPLIKRGQSTVSLILNREAELNITKEQWRTLSLQSQEVEAKYRSLHELVENLREQYHKKTEQIVILSKQENLLTKELQIARNAKELDEIIEQTQNEQAARKKELEKFSQTQQQYKLLSLLRHSNGVLEGVLTLLDRAASEEEIVKERRITINQLEQESIKKRLLMENNESELISKEADARLLHEKHNDVDRRLTALKDKLQARQAALDAGRCPTCGLEMAGEIGLHVHDYALQLQSEIDQLSELLSSLNQMVNRANTEIKLAKNDSGGLEKANTEITRQLEHAKRDELQAKKQAATFHQQASQQWGTHLSVWQEISPPDWLKFPSTEAQKQANSMLAELSAIDREYDRLQHLKTEYETNLKIHQRNVEQRSKINFVSTLIKDLIAQLDEDLTICLDELHKTKKIQAHLKDSDAAQSKLADIAHQEWQTASGEANKRDTRLKQLEVLLEQDREQLQTISRELLDEQIKLSSTLPGLADHLLTALEDNKYFTHLDTLAQTHMKTSLEADKLHKAELEVQSLEAVLHREQEELNRYLTIAGTLTSDQAEKAYQDAETHYQQIHNKLGQARQELGQIQRDNIERGELEVTLNQAKQKKWAFGQIESALKRGTKTQEAGPLMQQITNKLMQDISDEANRTLDRLGWHMSIKYDEKHGFQINDRTAVVTRRYQEFSGGEQFAVAIAVALAVSRVTNKSGYVRCLFIDEGFGALDGKHRKRIIDDAIGKLVESGMRDQVVVITHIEDMQEYFPHRIELRRKDDYSILVTGQDMTV